MSMADDEFALLDGEDEQQQQSAQQHQHQRYAALSKAPPVRAAASHLPPLPTPSPKKSPATVPDGESEDYGEAFRNCFSSDDPSFGTQGGNGDPSSDPRKQQQTTIPPAKRKEREDMSDGLSWEKGPKKLRCSVSSSSGGNDYRKDREEWSDEAIGCLLDAYTEKYLQLNRGNLRGRDWEDVATMVTERCDKHKSGKSVEQCKNKIDNLKKRYKAESQRLTSGALSVSHWPWFKKMELIISSSSSSPANKTSSSNDGDKSPTAVRHNKRYPAAAAGTVTVATSLKTKALSVPKWKRVVLKISGAALAGNGPQNVDPKVMMLIAREIAMANHVGLEVAVVAGGRNFFCGDTWVAATGIDRATAYQVGMMASVMNSILLQASLEKIGVQTRVQTAFMMQEIAEPYIKRRAIRHLEKGRVVIFGGIGAGTGSPLFTTDTAAALRASELNADAVLKGTNVDGVYDCSSRNGNAVAFEHISFRELLSRGFTAMDMTAITFCEENNIPIVLFNMLEPGNISRALCGDQVGTLIDQSGRVG